MCLKAFFSEIRCRRGRDARQGSCLNLSVVSESVAEGAIGEVTDVARLSVEVGPFNDSFPISEVDQLIDC